MPAANNIITRTVIPHIETVGICGPFEMRVSEPPPVILILAPSSISVL